MADLVSTRVGRVSRGPSPHLSWVELACRDGTWYPEKWRDTRAVQLAETFEWIRERFGGPIFVSSAYRTVAYNRSIGGAARSQHCEGRALDLHPIRRPLGELYEVCLEAQVVGLVTGLGRYHDFVHVDIRPGRAVTWRGGRQNVDN